MVVIARIAAWNISSAVIPDSSALRAAECTAPSRIAPMAMPSFTSRLVFRQADLSGDSYRQH
jgi:hypothetical protein